MAQPIKRQRESMDLTQISHFVCDSMAPVVETANSVLLHKDHRICMTPVTLSDINVVAKRCTRANRHCPLTDFSGSPAAAFPTDEEGLARSSASILPL